MKRLLAILGGLFAGVALAQDPTAAPVDPWVPPSVRKSAVVERAPTRGAELRAEVEGRLRAPFEAAAQGGLLTRERAQAAGLGFIARNFDAIDRAKSGAIRFEDYKRFLQERGAALD